MGFKPFYYRLPMRVRVWNLRRERRERSEFIPLGLLKQKRYRRKPWPAKRAISRAWRMTHWDQLFDPTIPF